MASEFQNDCRAGVVDVDVGRRMIVELTQSKQLTRFGERTLPALSLRYRDEGELRRWQELKLVGGEDPDGLE